MYGADFGIEVIVPGSYISGMLGTWDHGSSAGIEAGMDSVRYVL